MTTPHLTRRTFLATTGSAAAGLVLPRLELGGSRGAEERIIAGIRCCWCPAGRFTMGSPPGEAGRRPDEAQVDVVLTRGFWTAKYEATQGDWRRIVGAWPDRPPAEEFGLGDSVPMYWVNFPEAEQFCAALSARGHRDGTLPRDWEFRLPTEAQWEYACRAGTTTASAFGESLGMDQANFVEEPLNGGRSVRPLRKAAVVGSYRANDWGICDMHGNVFEWCRDWYHARLPGGTDPDLREALDGAVRNRDNTFSRVRRGGAWNDQGKFCRSALRLRYEPERRSDHIGFRVVAVRPSHPPHPPSVPHRHWPPA